MSIAGGRTPTPSILERAQSSKGKQPEKGPIHEDSNDEEITKPVKIA